MDQSLTSSTNPIQERLKQLENCLLDAFDAPAACWQGRLSSSALSTAVAVFALAQVDSHKHHPLINAGHLWLAEHQNQDGGWGDTPESPANLSTTLLALSALSLAEENQFNTAKERCHAWLRTQIGSTEPSAMIGAVLACYGNDRTFSAPILTLCALAGLLGDDTEETWRKIPQLPFELAVLPHTLFKFLNLSVVSYAIPALIAIGLIRHRRCPTANPVTRSIRNLLTKRVLKVLHNKQPENGGFLEATPLTAFVVMSLAASDLREEPTLRKGLGFLIHSVRSDGSWPIDTNLATWLTTLSVNALRDENAVHPRPGPASRKAILDWLLNQQFKSVHPFTCAAPGGWGWTDLPGSVPDADDTSGALRALKKLGLGQPRVKVAAADGIRWLLNLQNRDGGIPTFCRGWGKLPFDRSCPDITAHALVAMGEWIDDLDLHLKTMVSVSMEKMLNYLLKSQSPEGTWIPLWFGNQYTNAKQNPVYGTARVIYYLNAITNRFAGDHQQACRDAVAKGLSWLVSVQNDDGSWGGDRETPSSIEETAVTLTALSSVAAPTTSREEDAIHRGVSWLLTATRPRDKVKTPSKSSPIGLYFASLWYDEKLYPLIFAIEALKHVLLHKTELKSPKLDIT